MDPIFPATPPTLHFCIASISAIDLLLSKASFCAMHFHHANGATTLGAFILSHHAPLVE